MKFKEFFKNLLTNIKVGVSRFLTAFICSVLFFLTVSFEIIFETGADEITVPLCMAFGLTAVLSVLLKITNECLCAKLNTFIQNIICFAVAVASFILINLNYDSLYMVMAYTGIIIAMLCFVFFVLMRGENRDTTFPKIVASLIFAAAICGILSCGLSICIAAFQLLVFSGDNSYKVYLITNLLVWNIGFVNLFLALVPKADEPVAPSKIFRIFMLFIVLPLYILLIAILLIYLAKIVITRNMPVGEINWFASFASLFFIFILMSIMQYKEKLAKLFVRFGGYFLIPVLIMQAIAVFERINAYGLTTPRTVSLVLIVISVLFIAGAIISPKHLNKVALASGIIVLIVTITPFNVIDMPIASQTKILETTLKANDMLKNGVVVPNKNVSDEDAEKIISAYEYLTYDADKTLDFIPNNKHELIEIFGFSYPDDENEILYCSFATKESVSIADYTQMNAIHVYNENVAEIKYNNTTYQIDLTEIAKQLYAEHGTDNISLDLYVVDENTALYFDHFSFDVEGDTITSCYLDGYVLINN